MARKAKVPYDTLLTHLRQYRNEGIYMKAIAQGLGYSASHLYKLCREFGIKKQFKSKRRIDESPALRHALICGPLHGPMKRE